MTPVKAMEPRVSYSDLQRWPEDGRQYELYDGEVIVVPAPFPRHQRAVRELLRQLDEYARTHGGEVLDSPLDIVFSEYDVLQPDVVFFQASRRHLIQPDAAIRSAPDLAVEVLSPSTTERDRTKKMQTYARYGVAEYWIIDLPAQQIEVHVLTGGSFAPQQTAGAAELVRSVVLPDFSVQADVLFGD